MLDILHDYLSQTASPELFSAIEDALSLLDDFGVEDYEGDYEQLLMTDGSGEAGHTLTAITDLTVQSLRTILEQHGIELMPETRLSIVSTFVRGVRDIQNYEDIQAIVQLSMLETNSEEIFAECLALVCPLPVDELLTYVDKVDYFLISKLRTVSMESADWTGDTAKDPDRSVKIQALQRMCALAQASDLYVLAIINNGVDTGHALDVYVTPELEALSPTHAAKELLAAALVCKDSANNPRSVVQQYLDSHVFDIDKVTAINVEINKILLSLNNHEKA